MDAVDVGVATAVLNAFIGQFVGGFSNLRPAIDFLVRALLVLDMSLLCAGLMFGHEKVGGLLTRLLGTTFWLYLLSDFDRHASTFVRSLVGAGHIAAGGSGGAGTAMRELFNPSSILSQGFRATKPLHDHVMNHSLSILDLGDSLNVWIAQVLTMVAFWAIAANAVMGLIEYYWVVAVSGILLPFVFLKHTRWVAMKPLSMLLSSGVKLMALAFIMTVIGPILTQRLVVPEDLTTDHAWSLVIGAWLCAVLAFSVPRFAQGMMAGAGGAGSGEVVGGIFTTVGAVAGAMSLGLKGLAGAAGVASGAPAAGSLAARGYAAIPGLSGSGVSPSPSASGARSGAASRATSASPAGSSSVSPSAGPSARPSPAASNASASSSRPTTVELPPRLLPPKR